MKFLVKLQLMTNFQLKIYKRILGKKEIEILKRELSDFPKGHILFEYTIPRIGNRIDNVILYKGIVFLLEFKVGESTYPSYAIDQVTDYALDLSCFHKESRNKLLVPILVCTKINIIFAISRYM